MLAGLFTESLGSAFATGITTHDWSGVASELANTLGSAISSSMGSSPLAGFAGGLFTGLLDFGLSSILGGGGGSKAEQRGDSITRPLFTADVNTQMLLTQLLNATSLGLARRSVGAISDDEFARSLSAIGGRP